MLASVFRSFTRIGGVQKVSNVLSAPKLAVPQCVSQSVKAKSPFVPLTIPSVRSFHTTRPAHGLEEFFTNQQAERVGRAWTCAELRNKSFEDLQKLWFVLLKEKNMLATYKNLCRQSKTVMKNPVRVNKVKESMRAIKVVISERTIAHKFAIGDKNFIKRQEKKRVTRRAEKLEARKKRSTPVAWHPQNKTLTRKRKWTHLSPRANAAAAAAAAAAGAGAQEATVM